MYTQPYLDTFIFLFFILASGTVKIEGRSFTAPNQPSFVRRIRSATGPTNPHKGKLLHNWWLNIYAEVFRFLKT